MGYFCAIWHNLHSFDPCSILIFSRDGRFFCDSWNLRSFQCVKCYFLLSIDWKRLPEVYFASSLLGASLGSAMKWASFQSIWLTQKRYISQLIINILLWSCERSLQYVNPCNEPGVQNNHLNLSLTSLVKIRAAQCLGQGVCVVG